MASPLRSSSLPSPFPIIPLLLLGGLLLVAGCDSSVDLQQDEADPTTRTVPADSSGLALAPMSTGSELLRPGEPVPKNNADASAYGCYLASRPYSDEVAFHSRYLHFPEEVIEDAGGQTRTVARYMAVSRPGLREEVGVRYATCVIPDTDEAEGVLEEQLLYPGLENANQQALQDQGLVPKSTCTQIEYIVVCRGPSYDPISNCTVEGVEEVSVPCGGGSPPTGEFPDGSGGDDSSGGDANGECTEINPPPGSDCEPVDPCEGDNPPAHCEDDDPCVPSLSDLESIFENAEAEVVEDVHGAIEENISEFDIGGELEVAHFLGQVYHETGGLTTLEEGLYYTTAERLEEIWPGRFSETDPDLPDPNDYLEDPEKLANYVYADRMGNGDEESGDGWKYRGRGLFQLTGKNNYQTFTDFYQDEFDSSSDFVDTPNEIESDTELATISGMWFYDENVLSRIDEVTIEDVTRLINIGRVGQEERESKTNEAEQAIDCQ